MNKKKRHTKKEPGSPQLPGYPPYPSEEDLYNRSKETPLSDEEVPPEVREQQQKPSMDQGLDVPGAGLDDADEAIGEEDEENNYYSLGGEENEDSERKEEE